jgi:hypothetical protein
MVHFNWFGRASASEYDHALELLDVGFLEVLNAEEID